MKIFDAIKLFNKFMTNVYIFTVFLTTFLLMCSFFFGGGPILMFLKGFIYIFAGHVHSKNL